MTAYTNKLEWETLRSIDSATFTGSFQAIGTPLLYPSYILKIVNNSNVLITIAKDGTRPIDVAPATSCFVYDESKSGINSAYPAVPANTQFFVSGSAGTGSVYLVSQYIVTV